MYPRMPWEHVADTLGLLRAHFGNHWSRLLHDAPNFFNGISTQGYSGTPTPDTRSFHNYELTSRTSEWRNTPTTLITSCNIQGC